MLYRKPSCITLISAANAMGFAAGRTFWTFGSCAIMQIAGAFASCFPPQLGVPVQSVLQVEETKQ